MIYMAFFAGLLIGFITGLLVAIFSDYIAQYLERNDDG